MPFLTTRQDFDFQPLGKGKIRLQHDLVYYDAVDKQEIRVPAGFECDLASYPHLARPFFDRLGDSMRPAIVHDWLYERRGKIGPKVIYSKAASDRVLRDALKDEGAGWLSRWATWTGVAVGGWFAWLT